MLLVYPRDVKGRGNKNVFYGHVKLIIAGFLAVPDKLLRGQCEIISGTIMFQQYFPN